MRTQAEALALEQIAADQAAGRDPFGDDELDGQPEAAADDSADVDEPVKEAPAEDAAVAAEDEPKAAPEEDAKADEPADEPQPQVQQAYRAAVPEDYAAKRSALVKEKTEALAKLMDGEMEPADYAAVEERVTGALEDLSAARIRAETLLEANAQATANQQQANILNLMASAKAEIDYKADTKAQKQFDTALTMLSQDPDNAGVSHAQLVADAHRTVLAIRGITAKAAPAADKPDLAAITAARAAKNGEPPPTLRGIPAATSNKTTDDAMEAMGRLKGADFQAAFNKLSPAQRARMLDE